MIKDKNGKDWRVVALTPAGRKRHLEILKKYIEKSPFIDSWQLWMNTGNGDDINYMNEIASDKIEIKRIEGLNEQDNFSICKFFQYAQDEDTIYIRFDDDIVFIEDNAIENLLKARLDNPEPFVVFANIVNNALISVIHQRIGALGMEMGEAPRDRFGHLNHRNPEFAKFIHNNFVEKYKNGKLEEYIFPNETISDYNTFSINCFAFFGKDMKETPERDEELWISQKRPEELKRPNMICGNALVVHYAFFPQRNELDNGTGLLNFYKNL